MVSSDAPRPMVEPRMRSGLASTTSSGVAVALALPLLHGVAHAQSAAGLAERKDAPDEQEVLVRGRQAAGFVSRAGVEDAPREITDAASLVEPLPGVHVRRMGADDSFATLSIRGSSSSQVAVYLAGVPLSGGADPTLDVATLPLWPGTRAQVHRTFAPAALGRAALGGTLVLQPPSLRSPARTELWTAAGSFGARRLRVGDVRGAADGARIATGLSASRSDDDFTYVDPNATAAAGRDVLAERRNSGHAAAAGLAAVSVPFRVDRRTTGTLTVTGLAQARRQELPGTARVPTAYQRLDSSRLLSALELTLPAAGGSFGWRAWGRREGLSLRDSPISARATSGPWATEDAIVAAGTSVGWRGRPTDDASLELRLDGSAERFAPGAWIGSVSPPSVRRESVGIGLDASARWVGGMTVALSGRGDTWRDSSEDGASANEVRPTGNLGAELPIGPVIVSAHGGFVARPPSFVERYGNRGAFIGDPRLKPESALTVDAGARAAGRLGPLRLQADSAAFATWADDLITFVYAGADGRARATNIGKARLFGVESDVRASAYGVEARLSHTALATANESACAVADPGACERPPLPGRPAHDIVADLAFSRGRVRVRYGVDVVAGIAADVTGRIEVPARVLHGAGVRIALSGALSEAPSPSGRDVRKAPGLTLALDLQNLLDLRAADYAGVLGSTRAPIGDSYDYPLPGRRVLMSIRWVTEGQP